MLSLVDLENITIFYPFSVASLIDLIASLSVLILVNIFVAYFVKRRFVIITIATESVAFIAAAVFKLEIVKLVILFTVMSLAVVSIFINLAETRYLLANKASQRANDKGLNKKAENDTLFSHEDLYKTINDTTLYLSKHKIGAIMTFERKDNFRDIELAMTYEEAMRESGRCLRCDHYGCGVMKGGRGE